MIIGFFFEVSIADWIKENIPSLVPETGRTFFSGFTLHALNLSDNHSV
jgi:hypothetical protein